MVRLRAVLEEAHTFGGKEGEEKNIPSTTLRVNSEDYLPSTALRAGIESECRISK